MHFDFYRGHTSYIYTVIKKNIFSFIYLCIKELSFDEVREN